MLGILRGSLVTACGDIVGDSSPDAKTKLRRTINEEGPGFCQFRDWAFLHTTVTFTLSRGVEEYSGDGKLPLGLQRLLACKVKDSNDGYSPIEEKALSWYEAVEDPEFQGTPYALILRGLDSNGYPRGRFYYSPDNTYTFEGDCALNWTDVSEESSGDATRIVITLDCYSAFKYWVSKAYAVVQGDAGLVALCDKQLWGDPTRRIPGLMDLLGSKQRGARKKRGFKPSGAYKAENRYRDSDYGLQIS